MKKDEEGSLDCLISAVCSRIGEKFTATIWSKYGVSRKDSRSLVGQRALYEKLLELEGVQKNKQQQKVHRVIEFIENLAELDESSEVKHFLLLTLSEKFSSDFDRLREVYGVPSGGFTIEKDVEAWSGLQSGKDYGESLAEWLGVATLSRWTPKKQTKKLEREIKEIEQLMDAYGVSVRPSTSRVYFLHGLNRLDLLKEGLARQIKLKPRLTATTPSQCFALYPDGRWHNDVVDVKRVYKFEGKLSLVYPELSEKPSRFFICITVDHPELKKADITRFLDAHLEEIKAELAAFRPKAISSAEFGQHWLFYFLKEHLHMKRKDINKNFATARLKAVESNNSRQIVARIRRDIAIAERYKQS